jgi:hypothetical protein
MLFHRLGVVGGGTDARDTRGFTNSPGAARRRCTLPFWSMTLPRRCHPSLVSFRHCLHAQRPPLALLKYKSAAFPHLITGVAVDSHAVVSAGAR